ncbi:hypothetical protein YC2023_092002 [Brassica napus]
MRGCSCVEIVNGSFQMMILQLNKNDINKVSDEMENHNHPSFECEAILDCSGHVCSLCFPATVSFYVVCDFYIRALKQKGHLEALRPKLQPTPHQQPRARRMALSSDADDNEPLDDHQCCASAVENTNLKDDGGSYADAKDNIK